MIKIKTNVINPESPQNYRIHENCVIIIDNAKIEELRDFDWIRDTDAIDKSHCLCLPGFIDLHVHLSQYRIRGKYKPALLPWLNEVVFPEEYKSHDYGFAKQLAEDFFGALLRSGTTSAVIYTAPFYEACQAAFEIASNIGFRAIIGMTLMDRNAPEYLLHSTSYALDMSSRLIADWQHKDQHLEYIFTPRFAPTCTKELMCEVANIAQRNNIRIQSHLSENPDEIKWVKDLFGMASYTEVYSQMKLLGDKTIMAHAIHLCDTELQILKESNTKIAHCPDSNFYLKSGEFPLQKIIDSQLNFALGSDVGAGTVLDMLYHAKMANYRQRIYPLLPAEALYRISLGAAKVLGLEEQIGSLGKGKDANMIFFDISDMRHCNWDDLLSSLVFYSSEFPKDSVWLNGRQS